MRSLGVGAACALALLVVPSAALAGTGGYASHVWSGCGGGYNSGSWDDAGRTYVPCGNPSTIGVYDQDAHLVQRIAVDGFVSDVAPTRDGRYLYLANGGAPRRLVRGADGSYSVDASWSAARYPMYGTTYAPGGMFVATDAAGNVYYADGTWADNSTHTVVKYSASGAFVTRFGEWSKTWSTGTFYWALGGLAVSADGATIYTVELGNNRVQRWRRGSSGAYAVDGVLGANEANNADRGGYCDYAGWLGKFAAPYDVALDRADNLYVINTTCKQVLKFAPGFGALLANLDVRVAGGDYPRPHGFTVGADGTVYVGENQRALRPGGGSIPADGAAPTRPSAPAPTDPAPAPAPPAPDPAPEPTPPPPATAAPTLPVTTPAPVTGGASTTESPATSTSTSTSASPSTTDPAVTPRPERPVSADSGGRLPAVADHAAPTFAFGAAAVRALRLRIGRAVRLSTRCSERCRVEVRVVQDGRQLGRSVTWLDATVPATIDTRLGTSGRGDRLATVQVVVRDRVGNERRGSRTVRLPR